MSDYSQPDFYRFNEDSLKLVQFVSEYHSRKPETLLDLGAGCGVIGLELATRLRPEKIIFLEIQKEFRPYLEENCRKLAGSETQIISGEFKNFTATADLIVCNPPYYLPGHGQPYKSSQREIARSFVRGSWEELLDCIGRCLSINGRAYIIIKKDQRILTEMNKVKSLLVRRDHDLGKLLLIELLRLQENVSEQIL